MFLLKLCRLVAVRFFVDAVCQTLSLTDNDSDGSDTYAGDDDAGIADFNVNM